MLLIPARCPPHEFHSKHPPRFLATMFYHLLLLAGLLLSSNVARAQFYDAQANYFPNSNVTQHSRLDLDVKAIDVFADAGSFAQAEAVYENGENSKKTASLRKIKDFSITAPTLMVGQKYYEMYKAYYQSGTYADAFIVSALRGTGDFEGATTVVRSESTVKGMQTLSIWMYVIREMFDAIDDCRASNSTRNDAGVLAIDEAWAFYAGSLEGKFGGTTGLSLYNLAQKRCAQFGTCDVDGNAKVNKEILAHFAAAQAMLRVGQCDAAYVVIDTKIVPLMTVPLIQSMLRYVHRGISSTGWPGTQTSFTKERAEGWVFTLAVLPQIAACNPGIAVAIKTNMYLKAVPFMKDGSSSLYPKIQSLYSCLKITCEQVGTFVEDYGTTILPKCVDVVSTVFDPMAMYKPSSNVRQHSFIDLDIAQIDAFADDSDYGNARSVYTNGMYSRKSTSLRKLRDFSITAPTLMGGQKYYERYRAYWDSSTYADDLTQTALLGTGDFTGASDVVRGEAIVKSIQYETVWMYVIRELTDAVDDCLAKNASRNDAGVLAWDEAWAFYAGSFEGTTGGSSGQLGYALAQKRCAHFATCDSYGKSIVNKRMLGLFSQGQALLSVGDCSGAAAVIDQIVPTMTIPLIQALIRYTHRGSTAWLGSSTSYAKERTEGWIFARAVLPQIHHCNPKAAAVVRKAMYLKSTPYGKQNGDVIGALQSVYSCLGVSCQQIGTYKEDNGQLIMPACKSFDSSENLQNTNAASDVKAGNVLFATLTVVAVVVLMQ